MSNKISPVERSAARSGADCDVDVTWTKMRAPQSAPTEALT
jgi:hypothetical protein